MKTHQHGVTFLLPCPSSYVPSLQDIADEDLHLVRIKHAFFFNHAECLPYIFVHFSDVKGRCYTFRSPTVLLMRNRK